MRYQIPVLFTLRKADEYIMSPHELMIRLDGAIPPDHFLAEVTQFLLPNGKQRQAYTVLPDKVRAEYIDMQNHGCRLEAELLQTGMVSITVSDDDDDLDISITPNDNAVIYGLIEMLQRKRWANPAITVTE